MDQRMTERERLIKLLDERIIEGFGVTAFYTREEAEAALAERGKS